MASARVKTNCTGVVKFFNTRRGTGLVRVDDSNEDIYINVSQSYDQRSYDRGAKVRFNLRRNDGGASLITDLRPA